MHGAPAIPFSLLCRLGLTAVMALGASCGSRTDTNRSIDGGGPLPSSAERCNGLDDDGVKGVDDPFRDSRGRYVTDAHCGACNQPCAPRSASELVTHCEVVEEVPRCVASACAAGFAATREGRCEPVQERLCLPCANDNDCGALSGARCASIAGEARCSIDCALGCPNGYQCDVSGNICVPVGGSCSCTGAQSFELACAVENPMRDAGTPVCVGRASCDDGVLSACATSVEVCDHDDNDCDGQIDEGFADARGAYSLDQTNCGECGVSCNEDTGLELELTCGGDPFAPRCTLSCPDARNGIAVGDMLDGDLDVTTGCECKVSALRDEPGPLLAREAALDVNCDGADGEVLSSFYVATDGDDSWPGSPTRPARTIGAAIQKARASLSTPFPRPHVFVAAGTYTESIQVAEGVLVHGGYRRDFRALDPTAFLVEVRAPAMTSAPGGAVLVASGVGATATVVEGMSLLGLDATAPETATIGAYIERPLANLLLRNLTLRAGLPGEGVTGSDGPAGSGPTSQSLPGDLPRGALENGPTHECIAGADNVVRGGAGGQSVCGGVDVGGGNGGQASCPSPSRFQGSGARGRGPNASAGGNGGQDARGPIEGTGTGCVRGICCGLADFEVPSNFQGPSAGANGGDGSIGTAGTGCSNPRGSFTAGTWGGARGGAGAAGQPGSGGSGGGAGGGAQMNFMTGLCEFADGLGGGGGGGGAGGCGGGAGREGSSGAPSVALLVVEPAPFTMEGVTLAPSRGGRGGPGGAGGDGGLGGVGASGGLLTPQQRNTPTLAGTYPGARGGSGGAGGPGGGGGGGCGGSSVGLWIVGNEPSNVASWRAQNRFVLGAGGEGGAGGGGARVGSSGARGEAVDVVVQR